MSRRRFVPLVLLAVAPFALAACAGTASPEPRATAIVESPSAAPETSGASATWELVDPDSITPETTSLDVEVTRIECASGVTGDLLAPVVSYDEDRVTIRIDAAPRGMGAANCQGNDAVPVTVELAEPLGERVLIDGGCARADAQQTVYCTTSERGPSL